jgi:hypothetical protein
MYMIAAAKCFSAGGLPWNPFASCCAVNLYISGSQLLLAHVSGQEMIVTTDHACMIALDGNEHLKMGHHLHWPLGYICLCCMRTGNSLQGGGLYLHCTVALFACCHGTDIGIIVGEHFFHIVIE